MAISKTQPMRPAEIELVDTVNAQENTLALHQQLISALENGLADEISDREQADNALGNRIDAEAQAREDADAAESQARIQADNALGNRIDAEAQARIQADNALGNRIDAEVQARIQADNALGNRIDAEVQAREDADAAESQARIQADNQINEIIGEGFTSQDTIANSLSATNQQVLLLGQEVDANTDAIEDLQTFNANIKIGKIANIVVPANDSISTSYNFSESFPNDASCILLAQVITDELATLFTYTLIDCTYSGFSYSIANSDADPHTVALGFVAVNVNTI